MFARSLKFLVIFVAMGAMSCALPSGGRISKEQKAEMVELTIPAAMEVAYGNYDPKEEISESRDVALLNELDTDLCLVHPLLLEPFMERGVKKYMLITGAESAKSLMGVVTADGCHACAPFIGAFVFIKGNASWQVEIGSKTVTTGPVWHCSPRTCQLVFEVVAMSVGAWGLAPTPKLVRIGPENTGVVFVWEDAHFGVSEEYTCIIAPVSNQMKNIFFETTGEINFAENQTAVPLKSRFSHHRIKLHSNSKDYAGYEQWTDNCFRWSYKTQIRFVAADNKDYYDLEAHTVGSKVMCKSIDGGQEYYIVEAECVRKSTFSGEEYVLVEKSPLTEPDSCIENRSGCY